MHPRLAANQHIDGLYLDDIAFSRETVKRLAAVLHESRPEVVIDLHSANQFNVRDGFINSAKLYMEHFPYITRLWFGEYFDYDQGPDYWMTEVAGVPFGLGRPVRAVALTHAHDDHAGGARAFAAAGADVYAPAEVSEFLTAALSRSEMPADRLSALGDRLEVRPVTDRIVLSGPSTGVTLIALGPGPHGSASLGLWATEQGFFFQSDLHVPNTVSGTPRTDRAATECWFAEWAVATLPPETIVVSSHTLVHTPISRLAQYLETATCRGRQSASRRSGRRPFEDRLPVR